MFDNADSSPRLQRARGRARVGLALRGGRTRLEGLAQAGCAKAFLPRVTGVPEIVFLNTAGGLTGGDRLDYGLVLGPGAEAVATTQTAERAYAAPSGARPGEMRIRIAVGRGARLDWVPQETILFEHAHLERSTEIALEGDARLLMCEALVLGRAAMGETLSDATLFDRRSVTRDGRPVLVDAVALDPGVLARRDVPAGLGGARAVATLAFVAPGAEQAVDALRALPLPEEVRAGVSGWDGRCVMRLAAPDGWPLRRALAEAIRHLRRHGAAAPGADLPRVWQI